MLLVWFRSAEIEKLAAKNNVGIATLQHIVDGLRQPTDHDIRVSKYNDPQPSPPYLKTRTTRYSFCNRKIQNVVDLRCNMKRIWDIDDAR